jgi:hypothetical protein
MKMLPILYTIVCIASLLSGFYYCDVAHDDFYKAIRDFNNLLESADMEHTGIPLFHYTPSVIVTQHKRAWQAISLLAIAAVILGLRQAPTWTWFRIVLLALGGLRLMVQMKH